MAGQNRDQRHNNRGGGGQQQVPLPEITLDYIKDSELFNETAKKVASAISSGTKPTQIRNFYDYVLELNERAKKKNEDFENVLPFVKMLNSKAHYARERKVASAEFVKMISSCTKQISTKEQLEVFKLFFEAVIGFFKKTN